MKLTPEGERLYRHVKIAVEQLEAGEAELMQSRSLQAGTVFLATSEGALRCLLIPVLAAFRARYPGVRLRISNYSTPQAIAALRETTADFAVVTTPVPYAASFQQTDIRTIHEVAVCAPVFQELLNHKVTLEELRAYPLITLGADTQSHALYSGFFTANGLPFQPDIEAFTADQILPMVQADLGIGFVPEDFLREGDGICRIQLTEPIPERHIVLIKRKEQPLSMAAKALEQRILQPAATV